MGIAPRQTGDCYRLASQAISPLPIEPPPLGNEIEIPKVGGLHHHYTRKVA